jgi:hypothetical protein
METLAMGVGARPRRLINAETLKRRARRSACRADRGVSVASAGSRSHDVWMPPHAIEALLKQLPPTYRGQGRGDQRERSVEQLRAPRGIVDVTRQ